MSFPRPRPALNWLAAMILLAGLTSAALIWRAQDRVDRQNAAEIADGSVPLAPLDSRRHVRDVEINYGRSGVLIEQADDLLHGKPLARTILVVTMVTSAVCFLAAAQLRGRS